MNKIRKISALLGIKGLLAVASLTTIALALVVYTASVTMAPTMQFELGVDTASWTVYINEQDEIRYLPGGSAWPADGSSTYAFRVTTDANKVCAVQIELTSAMSSSLFSNFDITVLYWSPTGWQSAQLYDAPTGGTAIGSIDGTTTNAGYIQQAASTTRSYLIRVTYSYDLEATLDAVTATFQYTPLPANA